MESLLIKVFATALALSLSLVTTTPNAVKTEFDRNRDQQQVAQLLHSGCIHMLKSFDLENINIDDLIATAMNDPQAIGESYVFHGINFADLQIAYRHFWKNERVGKPAGDLGDMIDFYNTAVANLPDDTKQRRIWVSLADIPDRVRNAFIAAEDRRFYQHKGIDKRGLIRAFIGTLAQSGRPQGGSTITQQIVKNLLAGDCSVQAAGAMSSSAS
jgi:hypothetical protein